MAVLFSCSILLHSWACIFLNSGSVPFLGILSNLGSEDMEESQETHTVLIY